MRQADVTRNTSETKIQISINLDGTGKAELASGVPFLDHMLDQIARHGMIDLKVVANGDTHIDDHHTVEDVGITLGQAFAKAVGDKAGITRYGHFTIPMDEALVTTDLDFSGRPYLVFNVELDNIHLGNYEVEMTEEFFRAFAYNCFMTLHINEHYGKNTHHIIEAIFKSMARAIKEAVTIDEAHIGQVVSSKGVL